MGDKYYIESILERLENAEKYINWKKFPMDKSPLKDYIKLCKNMLNQDFRGIPRERFMHMFDGPNLFLKNLIDTMYSEIGDQDEVGAKNFKSKRKSKSKSKSKRNK